MPEYEGVQPAKDDAWAAASHEGNEREQLQRWAKKSFTEKVRWLEEMHRLSQKLRHSTAPRRQDRGPVI